MHPDAMTAGRAFRRCAQIQLPGSCPEHSDKSAPHGTCLQGDSSPDCAWQVGLCEAALAELGWGKLVPCGNTTRAHPLRAVGWWLARGKRLWTSGLG